MPGEFPDCGCHYTRDDDGIHFCPMHKAAPKLLEACKRMVADISEKCVVLGWDSAEQFFEAAAQKRNGEPYVLARDAVAEVEGGATCDSQAR